MQRYVGDTALIEPFNSIQNLLTILMCSNMLLNGNFLARAEIWRWKLQIRSNHVYGFQSICLCIGILISSFVTTFEGLFHLHILARSS